jgi:hypothetical protein
MYIGSAMLLSPCGKNLRSKLEAFLFGHLQIPTVKEEIRRYSSQYSARLSAHPNDLIVNLIELPDNKTPAK